MGPRPWWERLLVLAAAALLAAQAGMRVRGVAPALHEDLRRLLTTTLEQRRLLAYGDCDRLGYGYLRRVTLGLASPDTVPTLRQGRPMPHVELLVPGWRYRRDPRVIVGVGVRDEQTLERAFAEARLVGRSRHGGQCASRWTLESTDVSFDRFSGLAFDRLGGTPGGRVSLRSLSAESSIGSWPLPAEGGLVRWTLPEARALWAGERLQIDVERPCPGLQPDPLSRVLGFGVEVDLHGHEIVDRRDTCFTAVSAS